MPLTKASKQHLESKWPSIVENHAKRASLRGPEDPVDDKITVKVWADQDDEYFDDNLYFIRFSLGSNTSALVDIVSWCQRLTGILNVFKLSKQ